tara:strand:- start:853 stop:1038 length:186 start_codon:yes stop_codon:yes gene_type:complete
MTNKEIMDLIDSLNKQILELSNIAKTLATEVRLNRELIGKNAELTKKITEVLSNINQTINH